MHHYHLPYKHNPSDKWSIYTTTAEDRGKAITNLLKDKDIVYDYRIIKQEPIEDNDTNIGHNLFKLLTWVLTMALVLWVVQQK